MMFTPDVARDFIVDQVNDWLKFEQEQ